MRAQFKGAGTYVLVLRVPGSASIDVGRLGRVHLGPGWYGYVGSALGPGGLAGRLSHHLGSSAHPCWHIDYLRAVARVERIWTSAQPVRREHDWARLLQDSGEASIAVQDFGSSDCHCTSHLLRWLREPSARRFRSRLHEKFPSDAPLLETRL